MARTRGDSYRPGSAGEGATFRVRCPNPECETVYTVPAEVAGKRARCMECGTRTLIPVPSRSARNVKHIAQAPVPQRPAVPEVRVGCIGRGHAGKTALFHALSDTLLGDYLPSGLHLDASDPRGVAQIMHEVEESRRLLRSSGLPPTLVVSHTRYCVFEGDRPRLVCGMREVIGQVLTHTLPNSDPRLQTRYADYLTNLVNAHVLWVVVPCPPPDPSPRDERRYAHDLHITMAYLREALRLRTLKQPAAVALVLSKTDSLFPSFEEAHEALTDDTLLRSLGPLVHLLEQSTHVSDAAIIPITVFGFGKAVLLDEGTERHDAPGSSDEPFGDEPIWLLKEGETPHPYNLDTLFLWSLLLGLLNRADPNTQVESECDTLCRMLRDDLESGEAWLVPIKGGVKLTVP